MAEPMPRDSLGRIVYVGDMIGGFGLVLSAVEKLVVVVNTPFGNAPVAVGNVTIDLAASPERTNYERYFADLVTHDKVVETFYDACDETPGLMCHKCVFRDLAKCLAAGGDYDCYEFKRWIDEPAVI